MNLLLKSQIPKFMKIGDNLDVKCNVRHMAKDRNNNDWHLFNTLAVLNRVSSPGELCSVKAPFIEKKTNTNIDVFIPTKEDDISLRNDFKMLVSRDLVKYVDEVCWMKTVSYTHLTLPTILLV